jgi:hypothetical protein
MIYKGSLEILRLMKEKQPELFAELIHAENSCEMTPLHKGMYYINHLNK